MTHIDPVPDLFKAPHSGSPTSKAAAERIEPHAHSLRESVYIAIRWSRDGLTDQEMQTRLRMPGNTQRARRVELVEAGRVRDSGRTRKTESGRDAVVWIAA